MVVSIDVDAVRASCAPEPQSAQAGTIGTNENVATAIAANPAKKIFFKVRPPRGKGPTQFIPTTVPSRPPNHVCVTEGLPIRGMPKRSPPHGLGGIRLTFAFPGDSALLDRRPIGYG